MNTLGPLRLRPIDDLEIPALLDGALTGHYRGRRGGNRELRVLKEVLVGERANPSQNRPGESAPDQRQVVLGEHARNALVVTRCSRVLDRLYRQPLRQQPPGGALMDPCRLARLLR